MASPFVSIPSAFDPTAPKFDGSKPTSLLRFLDEVYSLAALAYPKDLSQLKRLLGRYVDYDVKELWECLPQWQDPSSTPQELRMAILGLYPELDKSSRHSFGALEALLKASASSDFRSPMELAGYNRDFLQLSTSLLAQNLISPMQTGSLYMQGLPQSLRKEVEYQLHLQDPYHDPEAPYGMTEVQKAASHVLDMQSSQSLKNQGHPSRPKRPLPSVSPPTPHASPQPTPPTSTPHSAMTTHRTDSKPFPVASPDSTDSSESGLSESDEDLDEELRVEEEALYQARKRLQVLLANRAARQEAHLEPPKPIPPPLQTLFAHLPQSQPPPSSSGEAISKKVSWATPAHTSLPSALPPASDRFGRARYPCYYADSHSTDLSQAPSGSSLKKTLRKCVQEDPMSLTISKASYPSPGSPRPPTTFCALPAGTSASTKPYTSTPSQQMLEEDSEALISTLDMPHAHQMASCPPPTSTPLSKALDGSVEAGTPLDKLELLLDEVQRPLDQPISQNWPPSPGTSPKPTPSSLHLSTPQIDPRLPPEQSVNLLGPLAHYSSRLGAPNHRTPPLGPLQWLPNHTRPPD